MELAPQRFEQLKSALAAIDPTSLGLSSVHLYPGATALSPRSAVVCRLGPGREKLASQAAEHAARLVSARLGVNIGHGIQTGDDGNLACWVEYFPGGANHLSAALTIQALQVALVSAASATSANAQHRAAAERELQRLETVPVKSINDQSLFLIEAARGADIPVLGAGGSSVTWQFGWGSRSTLFFTTASLGDGVSGHQISWRKHLAKQLFRDLGLPTPDWRTVTPRGDISRAAAQIGWPCVVKPVDRGHGSGITTNIRTPAELQTAVALARNYGPNLLIEAQEPGLDHRLLVVDGRLIAAARREPPTVQGDGKLTIRALVAKMNRSRQDAPEHRYILPVREDGGLTAALAAQGLSPESVPPRGAVVTLQSVANFSAGGLPRDVTEQVHPQIRHLAELLARTIGLRVAGIDYITRDITRSHSEVGGGFIEVNAMPGLRLHMPTEALQKSVGCHVLGNQAARIPVTLIVGNAEAAASLAAPLRERAAESPGTAAVGPDWAQAGGTAMPATGLDAYGTVAAMLRNRAVGELSILWTGDLIREFGLPADKLARAVVIGEDVEPSWLTQACAHAAFVDAPEEALQAAFAD